MSKPDQHDPDEQPQVAHHEDGTVDPAPTPSTATIPAAETRTVEREHEHPEGPRPEVRAILPPTFVLLLGIAGAVIAIGGLKSVASIIAPTFLAITLIIAVFPI